MKRLLVVLGLGACAPGVETERKPVPGLPLSIEVPVEMVAKDSTVEGSPLVFPEREDLSFSIAVRSAETMTPGREWQESHGLRWRWMFGAGAFVRAETFLTIGGRRYHATCYAPRLGVEAEIDRCLLHVATMRSE